MGVLIVIAPEDFGDEELEIPQRMLEEAGVAVTLASTRTGTCTGLYGTGVEAQVGLAQVDTAHFDGVVFIGGPGAEQLYDDSHAHRIAVEMVQQNKVVAAIGSAPAILARAGVLAHRHATVIDTEVAALVRAGALVRSLGLVSDGLVITAAGRHRAHGFGARVARVLAQREALHPSAPSPSRATAAS